MPRAVPSELIEFLAPFADEVHELALGLRERVLTVMPNAHEFVWDATNAVSLAYTPTTRWQDSVVHIASYAKWVNLGFNDGASLDDSLGILVGTGSRVRHVSFRAAGDLEAPWLEEYLRAAMDNAGCSADMGTGERPSGSPPGRSAGLAERPAVAQSSPGSQRTCRAIVSRAAAANAAAPRTWFHVVHSRT